MYGTPETRVKIVLLDHGIFSLDGFDCITHRVSVRHRHALSDPYHAFYDVALKVHVSECRTDRNSVTAGVGILGHRLVFTSSFFRSCGCFKFVETSRSPARRECSDWFHFQHPARATTSVLGNDAARLGNNDTWSLIQL